MSILLEIMGRCVTYCDCYTSEYQKIHRSLLSFQRVNEVGDPKEGNINKQKHFFFMNFLKKK